MTELEELKTAKKVIDRWLDSAQIEETSYEWIESEIARLEEDPHAEAKEIKIHWEQGRVTNHEMMFDNGQRVEGANFWNHYNGEAIGWFRGKIVDRCDTKRSCLGKKGVKQSVVNAYCDSLKKPEPEEIGGFKVFRTTWIETEAGEMPIIQFGTHYPKHYFTPNQARVECGSSPDLLKSSEDSLESKIALNWLCYPAESVWIALSQYHDEGTRFDCRIKPTESGRFSILGSTVELVTSVSSRWYYDTLDEAKAYCQSCEPDLGPVIDVSFDEEE